MDQPFCMHVLCSCMKFMYEKRVVHYSSVYGILEFKFNILSLKIIAKKSKGGSKKEEEEIEEVEEEEKVEEKKETISDKDGIIKRLKEADKKEIKSRIRFVDKNVANSESFSVNQNYIIELSLNAHFILSFYHT